MANLRAISFDARTIGEFGDGTCASGNQSSTGIQSYKCAMTDDGWLELWVPLWVEGGGRRLGMVRVESLRVEFTSYRRRKFIMLDKMVA